VRKYPVGPLQVVVGKWFAIKSARYVANKVIQRQVPCVYDSACFKIIRWNAGNRTTWVVFGLESQYTVLYMLYIVYFIAILSLAS